MPTEENENNLVAHIVWGGEVNEVSKKEYIKELNCLLKEFLPNGVELSAYSEHEVMLPYSPTTMKKDKNRLANQTRGYIQVIDNEINSIEYVLNKSGRYTPKNKT